MNVALVFAGGSGQRMRNSAKPKQFLELYGKPIIIYTLEVFEKHPEIDTVVVPCIAGWEDYLQKLLGKFGITKVSKILTGGKDTQESKMIALRYLQGICQEDDIVLLHDAVRPLVTEKMITDNIASVREFGNCITAVPFTETAITSDDGKEIVDIPGYDSYIKKETVEALSAYKYVGNQNVYLTPNMTYKPRVMRNTKNVVVNGSVAVLIPKEDIHLTEKQMEYFSSDEYRKFYQIARNYQTRSLNVDATSVFFYGVLKECCNG